jgi:hypothetical protein
MSIEREFIEALTSPKRASELPATDDIFGWMIGSWDMEAVLHNVNGQTHKTRGEVHASWILEGRAIQDLFIFPRRADRLSGRPTQGDRYATTIRTYDRNLGAWRITFINPASDETSAQLIARRVGHSIEMEGQLVDGTHVRWRYQSISQNSFHYEAEKLNADGKSWHLYLELFGKRSGSQADAA